MARCDVELIQGENGETKRVLINGDPIAGLLKVATSSGPRSPSTVQLTLHATNLVTSSEVARGN